MAILERGYIYQGQTTQKIEDLTTENKRMSEHRIINPSADSHRTKLVDRHLAVNQK